MPDFSALFDAAKSKVNFSGLELQVFADLQRILEDKPYLAVSNTSIVFSDEMQEIFSSLDPKEFSAFKIHMRKKGVAIGAETSPHNIYKEIYACMQL